MVPPKHTVALAFLLVLFPISGAHSGPEPDTLASEVSDTFTAVTLPEKPGVPTWTGCKGVDDQAESRGATQADRALCFDGKDDVVHLPAVKGLPQTHITVAAWVKIRRHRNWNRIVAHNWINNGWNLFTDGNGVAHFGVGQNNKDYAASRITHRDRWHYIVGIYDGDAVRVFVDGQEGVNAPLRGARLDDRGSVFIGGGGWDPFDGDISDVRVWNHAQSPEEIRRHMFSPPDTSSGTLVGYYDFNEPDGNEILDRSLFHNHGTLGADHRAPSRVVSNAPVATPCVVKSEGAPGLLTQLQAFGMGHMRSVRVVTRKGKGKGRQHESSKALPGDGEPGTFGLDTREESGRRRSLEWAGDGTDRTSCNREICEASANFTRTEVLTGMETQAGRAPETGRGTDPSTGTEKETETEPVTETIIGTAMEKETRERTKAQGETGTESDWSVHVGSIGAHACLAVVFEAADKDADVSSPLGVSREVHVDVLESTEQCRDRSLLTDSCWGVRTELHFVRPFSPPPPGEPTAERHVAGVGGATSVPCVSVVIPVYNAGRDLPDAVQSIELQTLEDWEIIIVNDGSTDDSADVISELEQQLSPSRRVRVVTKANGGLADARNAGIQVAAGEWILPLDADDMIEKTFLEKAIAAVDANRTTNLVIADFRGFGDWEYIWGIPPFSAEDLPYTNMFHCSGMFRKEVWAAAGGYPTTTLLGYEDWAFWIAADQSTPLAPFRIEEDLFLARMRRGSMHRKLMSYQAFSVASMRILFPGLYTVEMLLDAHSVFLDSPAHIAREVEKKIARFPQLPQPRLMRGLIREGQLRKAGVKDGAEYGHVLGDYRTAAALARNNDWQPAYRLAMLQLRFDKDMRLEGSRTLDLLVGRFDGLDVAWRYSGIPR